MMIYKKIMFAIIFTLHCMPLMRADDAQEKKIALDIIASLSDDIAQLIINKHAAKDPEITKVCCVRLVTNLADAIASLIIKIKSNKEVRGVELLDQQEYQNALTKISDQLVSDIEQAE